MADPELTMAAARSVRIGRGGGPGGRGSGILKYPLDLGSVYGDSQNFVMFTIKPGGPRNRNRNAGSQYIALHIPPGALRTAYGGSYDTQAGGRLFEESGMTLASVGLGAGIGSFFGGHPLLRALGAVVGMGVGGTADAIWKAMDQGMSGNERNSTLSSVNEALVTAGALTVGSMAGTLRPVTSSLGVAINPHSALLYNGPSAFREHELAFDFWPSSYSEARAVYNIIQSFKTSMLPEMGDFSFLKSIYFNFPHEFFISFFIGTENGVVKFKQMDIKRSVLRDIQLDYDSPQGPAFYEPPTDSTDPMPVHTKMTLKFQETEFILSYENSTVTNEEMDDVRNPMFNAMAGPEPWV